MKPALVAVAIAVLLTLRAEAARPVLVTICHVPPNPDVTMKVAPAAVPAHLAHGDYLGACVARTATPVPPTGTPEPTSVPPTETVEPTEAPTAYPTEPPPPTDEPTGIPDEPMPLPSAIRAPAGVWMWLLWSADGDTCALVDFGYDGSYSAPGVLRQLFWCGWTAVKAWGGPVTENGWYDSSGHNLDDYYGYLRFDLWELKDRYQP